MAKRKYQTNTEAGIRSITQIRNLPSCQLTDEEFAKEFFDRFQAKAMIVSYVDEHDQYFAFGRVKKGAKYNTYYRSLLMKARAVFSNSDLKEID